MLESAAERSAERLVRYEDAADVELVIKKEHEAEIGRLSGRVTELQNQLHDRVEEAEQKEKQAAEMEVAAETCRLRARVAELERGNAELERKHIDLQERDIRSAADIETLVREVLRNKQLVLLEQGESLLDHPWLIALPEKLFRKKT